jgi:hypothetical protein
MVDRINHTHKGETRRPQPAESSSSRLLKIENVPMDDLIVVLANARENRRARQVTEWESMYQARRIST